jgi:hypothetical protein
MSLLKAAVAGFSAAGANVANKYLDDQIQRERAQFMADLQRKTSGQIREDDFAFKTDPGRVQTTRDIAAGDVAAKATATREAEKASMSDAEYQSMKDAQAEKEDKREVSKASLMAEARARQEARFRPRTGGPSLGEQIKERETILGRKLTQQELESFVGLGKAKPTKDDPGTKAAIDAVFKRYENGELTADKIGAELRMIQESVEAEPQVTAIKGAVQRARTEGNVAGLVSEMRSAGFTEAQMTAAGLTADEVKAGASSANASGGSRRQAIETTKTPDGRTVYRVKGTDQWFTSEREARAGRRADAPEPARQREYGDEAGGLVRPY